MGIEATGCTVNAPVTARGIYPSELARRAWHNSGSLTAVDLTRWLLRENLATLDDGGMLRPTELLRELVWPTAFAEIDDVG